MNTKKQLFQSIKVIVLALVLSVGFNFVYAKVPYKVAKPIADEYGRGFSHCLWLLFLEPHSSICLERPPYERQCLQFLSTHP